MNRIIFLLLFLLAAPAFAQQQSSSTDEEPAPPKKESSGSLMWILPTVLALGAGGYAWFVGQAAKQRAKQLEGYIKQVSSRQKKAGNAQASTQAMPAPAMKDDRAVQALDKRIGSLEKELEELRAELKRRTRTAQQSTPTQSSTQPSRQQPVAKPQSPQPVAQPVPSMMETVSKATAPAAPIAGPQTKWAKYADAGDGFNAASLSDEQDGEKIFELSVDGATATFRVATARGPQQLALHDPNYYLNKVCTYDTTPTPQSTITTETPGSLKLVGGKWVIQRPAKVRFS